jgi:putative hydrolase of the HAD superfamily
MTIKAIMVDVDGVLVIHPDAAGWSANLERDLGVSASELHRHFFQLHWADVIRGRAGLRERLAPVLMDLSPYVSCDQLIDYWFSHDAHVNRDLLGELDLLRSQGVEVHLATVQEHERARYLWENLGMQKHFDGLHYAADLGCAKPDLMFFELVTKRTSFLPSEIFFIDDKIENVEAARAAGWRTSLWTADMNLRELLTGMLDTGSIHG